MNRWISSLPSLPSLVIAFASLLPAASGCSSELAGGPDVQPDEDANIRSIAIGVCAALNTGHYSPQTVDDTISVRVNDRYPARYDRLKLYFLESDISEFAAQRTALDDQLCAGDVRFAHRVYERFLQRLDERIAWATELSEAEFDFDVEEELVLRREATRYATSDDELYQRWRTRIKFELLRLVLEGEPEADARERLRRRYRALRNRYAGLKPIAVIELYLSSFTTSFDPHSSYLAPRSLEEFEVNLQQRDLVGIGVTLEAVDGYITVRKVLPGGAAAKDGRMVAGDRIIAVGDGGNGPLTSIVEVPLSEVAGHLRGEAGTPVRVQVLTESGEKKTYRLSRAPIPSSHLKAQSRIIEATEAFPFRLAVIQIPSFYRAMAADVGKLLDELEPEADSEDGPIDGLVVDLRNNGGGLVSEAVALTGLFIDQGVVVQIRAENGNVEAVSDTVAGRAYDGPLLVLVNRHSASASEIFAGAIQDYRRGVVVGDSSTHGKGSVQLVRPLARNGDPSQGAIKLTQQLFYRPSGMSTQVSGVRSDVVLPYRTDLDSLGEAFLEYALPHDEIAPASYAVDEDVDEPLTELLAANSAARVGASQALQALATERDHARERDSRDRLVFSRAILEAERAETKRGDKTPTGDEAFGVDPYTAEVLEILADLIAGSEQ